MWQSSIFFSFLITVEKKCPVETSTMCSSPPPWCSQPMAVTPICLETTAPRMTCPRRMARAMSCGHVAERGCEGVPPERGWRILSTWPEISRRVTPWTASPCSTIAQYVCAQNCVFVSVCLSPLVNSNSTLFHVKVVLKILFLYLHTLIHKCKK